MQSLNAVTVKIEPTTSTLPAAQGAINSILNEVLAALEVLIDSGIPTLIDLRTLPLTQADVDLLNTTLGRGEVDAKVHIFGESSVYETEIAGVWRVRHFNEAKRLVADHIEVCSIPSFLVSGAEDIQHAVTMLKHRLRNASDATKEEKGTPDEKERDAV